MEFEAAPISSPKLVLVNNFRSQLGLNETKHEHRIEPCNQKVLVSRFTQGFGMLLPNSCQMSLDA
jgi:hypothetical protein